MALLQTKWIADDAVNDLKVKLRNNQPFRARNAADDADVNVFRVNGSDQVDFYAVPRANGDLLATEDYVDTAVGALAGAFIYKGTYDASTNTPALSDGTGTVGWLYRVSVAGTQDFGSGNITFQVGDKVVYRDGVWEKWDVIDNEFATSDTDDLAEGAANLYFTDTRARTATVVNSTAGTETDQAASVSAMKSFVAGEIANVSQDFATEVLTLSGTDISNGYVTLDDEPLMGSVSVFPKGGLMQVEGDDWEVDGVNGDRINFLGTLAAELVAGDKLVISYAY
jgi:hypothetical protein